MKKSIKLCLVLAAAAVSVISLILFMTLGARVPKNCNSDEISVAPLVKDNKTTTENNNITTSVNNNITTTTKTPQMGIENKTEKSKHNLNNESTTTKIIPKADDDKELRDTFSKIVEIINATKEEIAENGIASKDLKEALARIVNLLHKKEADEKKSKSDIKEFIDLLEKIGGIIKIMGEDIVRTANKTRSGTSAEGGLTTPTTSTKGVAPTGHVTGVEGTSTEGSVSTGNGTGGAGEPTEGSAPTGHVTGGAAEPTEGSAPTGHVTGGDGKSTGGSASTGNGTGEEDTSTKGDAPTEGEGPKK